MYRHHAEAIRNATEKLQKRSDVRAVLLVGTVANGTEDEFSDIDLLIVLDESDFLFRKSIGELKFIDRECAAYEGGYIDGKYISMEYIRQVGKTGSEAARYAFREAKILYSTIDNIKEYVEAAARYPAEDRDRRIKIFCSHMLAWNWYLKEAVRENNRYLLNQSASQMILFGGRVILAANERLFPYYKWFIRELDRVPAKPAELMSLINSLITIPDEASADDFCTSVLSFVNIDPKKLKWADEFIEQTEMNWFFKNTAAADI